MFINRFRFQEAALDDKGGGGAAAASAAAAAAAAAANGNGGGGATDWRTSFGADAAPALKDFKEPTDFFKQFNTVNTELTTLKAKPPQDWRVTASTVDGKVDENVSKALARYTDLPAAAKALLEAQTKIRSGELAKPLAKDAKPEEVAAWREANGIPKEVKGYFENLPQGLVIGKDDQPLFDAYGKVWHEHNLPPAAVHAMTKMYYDQVAEIAKGEAAVDRADSQKAVTAMRAKMGPDYDTNMSILNHWVDGMPADLKDLFKDATLGDGTRLFNSPAALEFLMGNARKLNPAAHLLPSGGEANMKSIESELAGLKKMMGDKSSEYWKGSKAAANQQRYRDLTTAQQQLKRA